MSKIRGFSQMSKTPENNSRETLIEVLEGRSSFYSFLAGFYFKPLTQEQIDEMAAKDFSGFDEVDPLLASGFNDITRFLRKRNTGTRQMLAIDFTSSFGGTQTYKGRVAVPYASVFLSVEGLLNQEPRNEVFRIFKRNRLRVADEKIPVDHLSFMFEFLATMSERAITHIKEGKDSEACLCLTESRGLITDYILTWFSDFAELANLLIEARFYRGVLRVTEGYLLMDLQTIDDLLEELMIP